MSSGFQKSAGSAGHSRIRQVMANNSGVACLIFYVLAALALTAYSIARPKENWDMLAYMALVLRWEGVSETVAHERSYAALENDEQFGILTGQVDGRDSEYRAAVYRDAESFTQQLPFYSGRVLYIGAAWLVRRAGVGLDQSFLIVNALALLVICATVYWWLRHLPEPVRCLASVLCVLSSGIVFVARVCAPDTMSAAFLCVGMALVLGRKAGMGLTVLLLSIGVRPNNVLWLVVLLVGFVVIDRISWRTAIGWAVAGSVTYVALGRISGHYGYAVLWHHAFVDGLVRPAEAQITVTLQRLIGGVVGERVVYWLPRSRMIALLLLQLCVAVFLSAKRGVLRAAREMTPILALDLCVVMQTLLFPDPMLRLYSGAYVAIAAASMALTGKFVRGQRV